MRRSNSERSERTRGLLMEAAWHLFTTIGYERTGTPAVVGAAGLTRGALYHHFDDKRALFRAVAEAEFAAVASEIEAATPSGADPIAALVRGGEVYLAAMGRRHRTRLLLVDAPAVLGRDDWEELDIRHTRRTLEQGLDAVLGNSGRHRIDPGVAASILGAAYDRAALDIEDGADPRRCNAVLEAMLEGLLR